MIYCYLLSFVLAASVLVDFSALLKISFVTSDGKNWLWVKLKVSIIIGNSVTIMRLATKR